MIEFMAFLLQRLIWESPCRTSHHSSRSCIG